MWKEFFKNIKKDKQNDTAEDQSFLKEIRELSTYLLSLLKLSPQAFSLKQFIQVFFQQSSEEQIENLPELYLRFEEYLTEIDPENRFTKEQLRAEVNLRFPKLVAKEELGFLFKAAAEEEIFLGKFFVGYLLVDIIHLFGEAQEQFFLLAKDWVDILPKMDTPLFTSSFETKAGYSPKEALHQLSHQICERLEKKMGEGFAQKIYDRNYNKIAKKYQYLASFPYVISLIPRKFLNTDKIGRLSNHQLAATLLNQVNYLEDLNAQLADRNQALEQAKEALKKAKKETEDAFKQLEKRTAELEVSQKDQEKTLKALQESNEELEQFAFVASHDLQEPLHTIEGYINLIIKEVAVEKNSDLLEFIDHTVLGVSRMRELIKDLLEYSRVGKDAHQLEEIDMEVLFEIVCYNLRRTIDETKAKISTDFSGNLVADRTQMMQLFQNLISNAIKFCEPSLNPIIHIACKEREDDWLCSVADEGIGIRSDQQAQIFALFKRFSPQGNHRGTGIGLAICKKIVEQHQGQIWVESEPQQGSTFYFSIKKGLSLRPLRQ